MATIAFLSSRDRTRRGQALVVVALMLPVLAGGMALSIDTGVIGTARAQLRSITDAAALAGAMQLVAPAFAENRLRGATNLSAEMAAARKQALAIGRANRVLRQAPVLMDNANNALSGDVVVGFLEPASTSAISNNNSLAAFFNSVRVTARRTAARGGRVPTPFGSIFGVSGADLTVESTATVRNHAIAGFTSTQNVNAQLLPIVLDKPTYDKMIGRVVDPSAPPKDQYTYNPATGDVTKGADGVEESLIYGVKKDLPGNWGTVKVGVDNNSTSTLGAQIRYGITPAQINRMGGSIRLDPASGTLILPGNPGLSAGIKDDLAAILGKPVTIPIYEDSGGNGNNAWYEVVEFAGVRLVAVNLTGNDKHVIVQPALVSDPTAIAGPPVLGGWSSGGLIRLYLSR